MRKTIRPQRTSLLLKRRAFPRHPDASPCGLMEPARNVRRIADSDLSTTIGRTNADLSPAGSGEARPIEKKYWNVGCRPKISAFARDVTALDAVPQISGFSKLKLADYVPRALGKSALESVTPRSCAHPSYNFGYLLFHCSFNGRSKSAAPSDAAYSPAAWLPPPRRRWLSVTRLYFQWTTAAAGLDRRCRHANLEYPGRLG
jgi:hypothetical protein